MYKRGAIVPTGSGGKPWAGFFMPEKKSVKILPYSLRFQPLQVYLSCQTITTTTFKH